METKTERPGTARGSLRQFLLYFLRLRTFGFGGPIVLAGHMRRDLVEGRGWISNQDYAEGPEPVLILASGVAGLLLHKGVRG